jgi:hypothetical protein
MQVTMPHASMPAVPLAHVAEHAPCADGVPHVSVPQALTPPVQLVVQSPLVQLMLLHA